MPVSHSMEGPSGGWQWPYLWVVVGLGVGVKAWLILHYIPSMWLWLDELYYFTTAYDFAHQMEVTHPGFLFYPPLTSLVIAPLHLAGLDPAGVYHAALVLYNILLTLSMVFGSYLIYQQLFGVRSLPLAVLLAFAPPAQGALLLMSEPLFVVLFVWFIYFFVRASKTGRMLYYSLAGVTAAMLPLTREIGILVIPALLSVAPFQVRLLRGRTSLAGALGRLAALCSLPIVAASSWRLLKPEESVTGSPRMLETIRAVMTALGDSPDLVLILLRNFLTSLSYISFSTLGVALPIVLWAAIRRRGDPVVRLVVLQLLAVVVFVAAGTALFMFGARENPLPRWMMYGRYVDYFAPVLFALALGIYRDLRREKLRVALLLVLFALALNMALSLVIPVRFYELSMGNQIAPNSLSLALPLKLIGGSRLFLRFVFPLLASAIVALVAFRCAYERTWLRWVTGGAVFGFLALNFGVAVAEVSRSSNGAQYYASHYSRFLTENPMVAADGVYLDWRQWGDFGGRNDLVFKTVADHLGSVIVGARPEDQIGRMPVLTKAGFNDRQVLYKHPRLAYSLYGVAPAMQPTRSGVALILLEDREIYLIEGLEAGFELGDAVRIPNLTGEWLAGDWDGDGRATLGIFDGGGVCLFAALRSWRCASDFTFGSDGDQPIVGDWNGDGVESVGVYRRGQFLLKNSNEPGPPDLAVTFGLAGDFALVGDWNGDGVDTLGVLRGSTFYVSNRQNGGYAEIEVQLEAAQGHPLVGDWDGNGNEWIGFIDGGRLSLYREADGGTPYLTVEMGIHPDLGVAGVWAPSP